MFIVKAIKRSGLRQESHVGQHMALLWSAAMLLAFKAINIGPRRGHTFT